MARAHVVIELYLFLVNPWMPRQWHLPPAYYLEEVWRLVIGLNCVGMWDELFFVNIVFATLRSLYDFRRANLGQAFVYASVLYDMAFVGIGPVVVYAFALTQGSMYEQSRNLFYVMLVHLIVDALLLEAIIRDYYPGHGSFHWFLGRRREVPRRRPAASHGKATSGQAQSPRLRKPWRGYFVEKSIVTVSVGLILMPGTPRSRSVSSPRSLGWPIETTSVNLSMSESS